MYLEEQKDLERRLGSSPLDFLRPVLGVGLYIAWWSGNEALQQTKHLYFHVVRLSMQEEQEKYVMLSI